MVSHQIFNVTYHRFLNEQFEIKVNHTTQYLATSNIYLNYNSDLLLIDEVHMRTFSVTSMQNLLQHAQIKACLQKGDKRLVRISNKVHF